MNFVRSFSRGFFGRGLLSTIAGAVVAALAAAIAVDAYEAVKKRAAAPQPPEPQPMPPEGVQ